MSVVMLPGVKVLPQASQVGKYDAPENARLDEEVLDTANPFAEVPEFAIVSQHQAKNPKRIFEEEKGIEE